jgi:hypothetical protein
VFRIEVKAIFEALYGAQTAIKANRVSALRNLCATALKGIKPFK